MHTFNPSTPQLEESQSEFEASQSIQGYIMRLGLKQTKKQKKNVLMVYLDKKKYI